MKIKKFVVEAVVGFTLWTILLTPYMIFAVHTTLEQYEAWLVMEVILTPPLSIVVVQVTNYVLRRLKL